LSTATVISGRRKRTLPAAALLSALLGAAALLVALRGGDAARLANPDSPRHAMNGVFLADAVRAGAVRRPVDFAWSYYARLPALSMPYHPPVVPGMEALFLLLLGVGEGAVHLPVALSAAAAAVLLFRLGVRWLGSAALAAAGVLLFFALPVSHHLATQVMLEFPAMALASAALLAAGRFGDRVRWRDALLFGTLAALAAGAKQHAVFLAGIPLAGAALSGRWHWLRQPALWAAAAMPALAMAGLQYWANTMESASYETWQRTGPVDRVLTNVAFYASEAPRVFGWAGLLAGCAAAAAALATRRARQRLWLLSAWWISVLGLLFAIPPYEGRYLFFAAPAVCLLAAEFAAGLLRRGVGERTARRAVAAAAAALFAISAARVGPPYLRGPEAVVRTLANQEPGRVLLCGSAFTNGPVIFGLRKTGGARWVAIRGDKLPVPALAPGALERFAHDYGVRYVVFETGGRRRPWDGVAKGSAWQPLATIPVTSSYFEDAPYTLAVYRFLNPSPHPARKLVLRSGVIRRPLEITLE
jgi:4-amino-4-deoxy-L-arabinose transferase-like glycosyltransferase